MKKVKPCMTPITNALSEPGTLTDNLLVEAIGELSLFSIFSRKGVTKRSGDNLKSVVFSVLLWPLLGVSSIKCFCGKFISVYIKGGVDTLYNFLKREDINWRGIRMETAKQVYLKNKLHQEPIRAFVVDDTLKHRRGKKVEGVSSHFDHTTCHHTMGQQILELGYATPRGFLSLDSQIFIGQTKVQPLQKDFSSKRSAVAKSYKSAMENDKNDMLIEMISRADRLGFKADYLLTDAWFGVKKNIKAALEKKLKVITMMKRSTLKYRFQGGSFTARELYVLIKRRMKCKKGQRFRTFPLIVELNLSEDAKNPEWVSVKLVFSSPKRTTKDGWVVLLSTDLSLEVERILQIYSLRWGIEVYFKEVKQNMGFLKEQTGRYTCHYASIHLSSIRYMLFFHLFLSRNEMSFGKIRDKVTGKLEMLSFAALLWELFRALIFGVLDQFRDRIGATLLIELKTAIGDKIENFLFEALQIDSKSTKARLKAENLGLI